MRLPVVVVLIAGCSGGNAVDGRIDGEPVPVREAFFIEEPGVWPNEARLRVVLTGLKDACPTTANYLADVEDDVGSEDQAASWAAWMDDEFWRIQLDLRVADLASIGEEFTGLASDDAPEQPGEVEGDVQHYLQPLDEAYWNGTGNDDDYVRRYLTDGGLLDVRSYEQGARFRGSFETTTVDFFGELKGNVTIDFDATHCPQVEDL